jgi:NTP pyrophosphatase (non-canonical NTP hydrolase)
MFEIGALPHEYPGVSKLVEELGELLQILGKLIATGGRSEHWSGLNLRDELLKEIGDVRAAIQFVLETCLTTEEIGVVHRRTQEKLRRFRGWHQEQMRDQSA